MNDHRCLIVYLTIFFVLFFCIIIKDALRFVCTVVQKKVLDTDI